MSGKGLQGENHTGLQNNTEEWGTTPVLKDWRRNTLLVLRCRNNAFPGSCRLQKPELPGLHLHNPQGHPAAGSTGMARLGAKSEQSPELTGKILWRHSQAYTCPHTTEHFPSTEVVYILHLSQGCRLSPRGCDPAASQWVCPYRTSG